MFIKVVFAFISVLTISAPAYAQVNMLDFWHDYEEMRCYHCQCWFIPDLGDYQGDLTTNGPFCSETPCNQHCGDYSLPCYCEEVDIQH